MDNKEFLLLLLEKKFCNNFKLFNYYLQKFYKHVINDFIARFNFMINTKQKAVRIKNILSQE